MEIVPEALGGKLISKSRWGKDETKGENFFSHFSCGNKKWGLLNFYSIFSEVKKYAGRYEKPCIVYKYFDRDNFDKHWDLRPLYILILLKLCQLKLFSIFFEFLKQYLSEQDCVVGFSK